MPQTERTLHTVTVHTNTSKQHSLAALNTNHKARHAICDAMRNAYTSAENQIHESRFRAWGSHGRFGSEVRPRRKTKAMLRTTLSKKQLAKLLCCCQERGILNTQLLFGRFANNNNNRNRALGDQGGRGGKLWRS